MTEPATPVDAGVSTPPDSPSPPSERGVEYYKDEAHRAFAKRDTFKEKLREAEAKIAELSKPKPKADAGSDLAEQLAALAAERDGLAAKLETQTKEYREASVLDRLMTGLPDERRKAITSLYRTHAAPLDDGTAEIADVVKEAGELLSTLAAPLFTTQSEPAKGRLPADGNPAEFSLEAERAKNRAALKRRGGTGVTL